MSSNRSFRSTSASSSNLRSQVRTIAILCVAALSGVAAAVHAQSPAGVRVTELSETSHPFTVWHCARLPIEVRTVGQALEVVVDGDSRILMPSVSASGARYVAPGDDSTEFWGKGGLASVTWSGTALPTCAETGTLVTPMSASGNEPFWALNYDGWGLKFSEPGQPIREIEIEGQVPSAGGWQLQSAKGQMPLQVDIADTLCQDSMSGLLRPYSVVLQKDGQTLRGCGGNPERLIQGVQWTLKSVGDTALTVPASLTFLPDGRLAGSNGCNRLIGSYAISGEGMRFSQLGSTRMACDPNVMQQADQVDQYLATVRGFSFNAQGGLVLQADNGEIVAVVADDNA
jgi:heat shock protein HslJ/membrane-bound inhibitor of C-type lysozyme